MFLPTRKRGERGREAGRRAGKKRRAIISQLLEISVSINLVSPRLRRRRCFVGANRLVLSGIPVTSMHVRACVSPEFRPIADDESIAALNQLADINTTDRTPFSSRRNDINATSPRRIGICQLA
jgi:hypothetical protein